MENIPLKLRLTTDPDEADIIRDALIDYARKEEYPKSKRDIAWSIVTVLSKKLIGR